MRKILIAIPFLHSGGVEVSLIRFLDEICKNKDNQIDLLMLKKTGMYLNSVPNNVNIKEVKYVNQLYDYNNKIRDINKYKGSEKLKFLFYRTILKFYLKTNNYQKYYQKILKYVEIIPSSYDLAIDWHGYGHFMTAVVADKVKAAKKAMWIHDEKNKWMSKIWYWRDKFDKIYCVGQAVKDNLLLNFPVLKSKTDVFYNIIDYNGIRKKSLEKCDFTFDKSVINIITVGRIEWQKGYDVAIETAKILKDKNFSFKWYFVGSGSLENELKRKVTYYELDNNIEFLGVLNNPFPYIKMADLYVLTSRHEGYCLATLEAKILGKIIIATDIPSNREQIKNNQNGILCKLDSQLFAKKIIEISNNDELKNIISDNLKNENFDFTFQLEKIYKLME